LLPPTRRAWNGRADASCMPCRIRAVGPS
jgi:hypothetical protein